MTKLIYEVTSDDLAKKGGDNYGYKYQQQEAHKDQKGINRKKNGYKTSYIVYH